MAYKLIALLFITLINHHELVYSHPVEDERTPSVSYPETMLLFLSPMCDDIELKKVVISLCKPRTNVTTTELPFGDDGTLTRIDKAVDELRECCKIVCSIDKIREHCPKNFGE